MKHIKTFETVRYYLNVFEECCPVCGTEGKIIDDEEFNIDEGEYTFKCDLCDFLWKQEYYYEGEDCKVLSHEMTDFNGDNIKYGNLIDDNLYNELKLQASKYNL